MTPPTKAEQIRHLHQKMSESLQAAQELLEKGHEEISISRAYYAMFYVTEALLLSKDMAFAKHSAVSAAFGQHFVKVGLLDPSLHRMLIDAFKERTEGDYGTSVDVFDQEEAEEALRRAQTYCQELTRYLQEKQFLPPENH